MLTVEEYLALPPIRRLGYRLYRNPAVMFGLGPTFVFFLQQRLPIGLMKEGWRPWLSTLGNTAVVAVALGVMMWLLGVLPVILVNFTTMVVAATIGVWLFFVQHQFEGVAWARNKDWKRDEAALHGSSHYDLPQPLRWLTANIGIHHVHHLSARIPFYRLPQVLKDHPELDSTGLWKQTFSNFMGNAANCWLNRKVPVGYNFLQLKHDGTIHDRQMADNLRWLADERYKDRKIIVWAQNRHVTKNIDQIEVDISNYRRIQNTTLGNEAFKKFGNDVFIIGFTSSEGTSGSPFQRNGRPYEVKPLSKKDFYTNVMQDLKYNYAFTDFRAIQKTDAASKAFVMRGWGYEFDMKGNWFNAFDGVFYIKSNKAATPLEIE